MSHFTIGAIVPRGLTDEEITDLIADNMERYSEHRSVEPYPRPCYCVGFKARIHGQKMASMLVGSLNERRDLFSSIPFVQLKRAAQRDAVKDGDFAVAAELEQSIETHWKTFNADFWKMRDETQRDYEEYHPLYGKPNPDCEECDGTGIETVTYNPDSKWDWYRVGGRWDGALTENRQESDNGFNFGEQHETLINNRLPLDQLLTRHTETGELFTFFALLTPEGEWMEKGSMGWFAMVTDEAKKEDWQAISLTVYEHYTDYDIVLLDAHI